MYAQAPPQFDVDADKQRYRCEQSMNTVLARGCIVTTAC
jgi:hypothetical protein